MSQNKNINGLRKVGRSATAEHDNGVVVLVSAQGDGEKSAGAQDACCTGQHRPRVGEAEYAEDRQHHVC